MRAKIYCYYYFFPFELFLRGSVLREKRAPLTTEQLALSLKWSILNLSREISTCPCENNIIGQAAIYSVNKKACLALIKYVTAFKSCIFSGCNLFCGVFKPIFWQMFNSKEKWRQNKGEGLRQTRVIYVKTVLPAGERDIMHQILPS